MFILKTVKQTIESLLPIIIVVSLFSSFAVTSDNSYYLNFLTGFVFVFIGLVFLYLGLSVAIDKLAHDLSYRLVKTGKKELAIIVGAVIALIVVLAEPSLLIISKDISTISNNTLKWYAIILAISASMTFFMIVGLARILFRLRIKVLLTISYSIVLLLFTVIFLLKQNYLSSSLDLACSATGALSVPFFLSFGIGLGRNIKNSYESQRFGLVGIIASGSFIGSTIYFLIAKKSTNLDVSSLVSSTTSFFSNELAGSLLQGLISSAMALAPFIVFFIIFQFVLLKYDKFNFVKVSFGLLFLFIGLLFYLSGLTFGFMKTARTIGQFLGKSNTLLLIFITFIIGFFCLFAESSAAVLGDRINEVTSGSLHPKIIVVVLACGAGLASAIFFLFVYFEVSLLFIVLPLVSLSLILSHFTSSLFVGIAFDAGAVSSGPMAGAFLLPFLQGIAIKQKGISLSIDHLFGILSLITIFPIILVLCFGIIYESKLKSFKRKGA